MRLTQSKGCLYFELSQAELQAKVDQRLVQAKTAQQSKSQPQHIRLADTPAVRAQLWEALGPKRYDWLTADQLYLIRPDLPPLPALDWIPDERVPSWPWQVRGFWELVNRPAVMLAMGMATGKTKVVIEAVRFMNCHRALVICLSTKILDWVNEFREFAPSVRVVPLIGSTVDCAAAMRVMVSSKDPVVLITNVDKVWRGDLGDLVLEVDWDLVAIDENKSIRSPGGEASKFLANLYRVAKHRTVLSGTPMAHAPEDIFAQYRILDPGIFGTAYEPFKQRYIFFQNPDGTGKKLGYINQEELSELYHSIAYEVPRDVLNQLPARHIDHVFELSDAERSAYTQMEEELIAELDQGTVQAANLGVRAGKLQQIAGGFLIDTPTGQVHQIGTTKLDKLADWLDEIAGEPAVIFARFRYQLAQIAELLKGKRISKAEISGAMNESEEWKRGKYQVLVAQHASGGVGLNLERAHLGYYYSIEWSLNTYEQSLARLDRPKQKSPVTYYHSQAEDTVEQDLYSGLADKKNLIQHILSLARGRVRGVNGNGRTDQP